VTRSGAPVRLPTGPGIWSLPLRVTPAVLVPRPETEILVDLALQRLPRERWSSVLDLVTGSGAIALAIASERPGSRVTASISRRRRSTSRFKSRDPGCRTSMALGSWFAPVSANDST